MMNLPSCNSDIQGFTIVSWHYRKMYVRYLIHNKQILIQLSNDKTKIKLPNNLEIKQLVLEKTTAYTAIFHTAT
jgi:hypothetical protein